MAALGTYVYNWGSKLRVLPNAIQVGKPPILNFKRFRYIPTCVLVYDWDPYASSVKC